jgi:hypothetical protein
MSRPKKQGPIILWACPGRSCSSKPGLLFLLHNPKKEGINFIKFFYTNKRDTPKIYLNYDENQ